MKLIQFFFFFLSSCAIQAQDISEFKYQVYFFLGEDCRICQYYAPTLNEINAQFSSDSIGILGLFPSRYSTEKGIDEFKAKYQLTMNLKREYFGTKAKKFGVKITPEVIIYDSHEDLVLYRGRIDNSYHTIGQRRRVITSFDLKDFLTSLQKGNLLQPTLTEAIGCFITFRN